MGLPRLIINSIRRRPISTILAFLTAPTFVIVASNFLLNYLPHPPAVEEGRARRQAYIRHQITKEEYLHPELLKARREREEREAQAREAFRADKGERRRRWDEVREEGRKEQERVEEAKQGAGKALKLLSAGVDEDAIIKDGAGERKAVPVAALPALNLLAEIEIELGDAVAARRLFEKTVELDPEGSIPEAAGGGAEKFLWLAQLCEEGGMASVRWYERGAEVLRGDIARLGSEGTGGAVEERRKKLAAALCSIAEVYMTDLSWEIDAEARCEALIAQALLITPSNAETLQTLANIRISQGRIEEAKKALTDSIGIWQGKMEDVPPFPTRISLARLLLEVHEEEPALKVVERLVREDDQSVEAWYLGGWCLYLLGTQTSTNEEHAGHSKSDTDERKHAALISSREWLRQSLALCTALEYEDERLREHAEELVGQLDDLLRSSSVDGEQEEGEKWESEGDDEEGEEGQDEEMFGTWKQL